MLFCCHCQLKLLTFGRTEIDGRSKQNPKMHNPDKSIKAEWKVHKLVMQQITR